MKSLNKFAAMLAGWPLIGPLVRFTVALRHLSTTHDRLLELSDQTLHLENELRDQKRMAEQMARSLQHGLERTEFVRRELMYEMRYGAREASASGDRLKVEPRIVSQSRLEDARASTIRLNLGCGHLPLADYLNVDRRPLDGVDIIAEVDDLPFATGEVDEIYSAHLLEHFPQEQLLREVIPYWRGLLREGGVFRAVVPDAEAMIRGYAEGTYPYTDLREVTFGAQDYDGDFHFNMFTPDSLTRLLGEAGFESVEIIASSRKNGACFEFEIIARAVHGN